MRSSETPSIVGIRKPSVRTTRGGMISCAELEPRMSIASVTVTSMFATDAAGVPAVAQPTQTTAISATAEITPTRRARDGITVDARAYRTGGGSRDSTIGSG